MYGADPQIWLNMKTHVSCTCVFIDLKSNATDCIRGEKLVYISMTFQSNCEEADNALVHLYPLLHSMHVHA